MNQASDLGFFAGMRKARMARRMLFGTWLTAVFIVMLIGLSAPAQAQVINITSSPTSFSTEGETITFTYELENLGSYYLTSIDTITPTNPDPGGGPGVTMGACESFPGGELAPNETVTCTGTYQITDSNIMSGQLTHQVSMAGQRIGGTWNVTSSNFTMQLAGGGPTSTSVESLTNPSELGDGATFRATVASFGCNAGLAPQGTVTFKVGSVTSSAIAVTPISPISGQGTAEFTTNSLPAGSYPISAVFTPSGADNCGPSTGSAFTNHVVNEPLPALPVVNNTNTVVDGNSADNPVTLDISGEDIQSVAVASGPSSGTATVSGTDILYTPDSGFSGTDSFTYTATNAAGTSSAATATIAVESTGAVTVTWTVSGGGEVEAFNVREGDDVTSPAVIADTSVHFLLVHDSGYVFEGASDNCGGQLSSSGSFWQLPDPLSIDCHVDFTFTPANAPTVSNTDTTVNAGSTDNPVILDIEGFDIESVAIASGPSNGTATISGTDITYTPNADFSGTDSFTYTAANAAGTSAPATATITVEAIDPVLRDLSFETEAGTPFAFSVANDGVSASYFLVTAPTNGTIVLNADGSATYTPNTGFSGEDTFIYDAGADGNTGIVTINVVPPIVTLEPGSLSDGVVYADYSAALSANGGVGPYNFTVMTGNLPQGLALDSDGTLSGAPTEAGIFSFTVTATDENDFTGSRDYSLNIAAPEITLGPVSLPAGTGGASYGSVTLTAAGGMGAYEFTTSDTLPDGISLAADGTLSGSPREDGSFTFTVTAKDENGFSGTRDFTLAIDAPEITIGPDGLPNAVAGKPYEAHTFTAAGGNAPYRIALDGTLPQGMSLEDGKLSGTPTEAGNFQFNLIAEDRDGFTGQRGYTLNVGAPDISLTPRAVPEGTVYADYIQAFTANGGTAPYSYQITAGRLPDGMTLENGTLSGTPREAGDFPFSLRASDGNGFTVAGDYTLTVVAPGIALTPEDLPDGLAGTEYEEVSFTGEGGKAPYSFELEGDLPEGMRLTDDALSGTPSEGGIFNFTVTATDAGAFSGQRDYTLTIAAPEIEITPETLSEGAVYADYAVGFTADGGVAPYGFELDGDLPEGLTFENGRLSGQPVQAGEFSFTVTAMDKNGFSGEREYTLSLIAPDIAISPESLPDGLAGTAYDPLRFTAAGGDTPYSFELEGDLPEGINFKNGALSGMPTEAGEFTFTMHATDPGDFTGKRDYTLTIAAPNLVLAPDNLPGGRVNSTYSASLQAEGGTAPYGFAVTQGQLPEGLRLADDGTLSGTPVKPGRFTVTTTVTDRYGFTGGRDYVIAIEDITLPRPRNHELTVMAGTSGRIDLTRGASGGPFTDATIVANPADDAGAARIAREGGSHVLHFSASGIYAGTTSLSYTLSNADGISDPASVMITVVARPDPSLDPEVIGLVRAQSETAKRFAKAQIRNFSQRLEQLHDEGTRRRNSIVLNLTAQSSRHDSDSMSLRGPERFGNQSNDLAFWSGGYVDFGSSDDDGIDLDHTLVGISAGADYRFTPKFTAGLGLGYGRDVTDIGDNGTESRAKALSMAAYGSYRPKPGFFIDGLAGYSSLDFDSKRYVTSTGDMATGTRGGEQLFAALTAGYEHRRDGLLISPYGRLSASRSTLDMFTEEGGGVYNLTYDEQIVETLSGTLGLRFEHSRPMDWGNLTSRARIEYTHEFDGSSEARIGYADLGTFPYAIDVEGYSRDELAIGLGLDAQIGEFWTLGLDYRTAFGTDGDSQDQSVAVKLDVRF